MTNEEWIKGLSRKELATQLLRTETVPDYDEDWDEDLVPCGEQLYYITSDGVRFWDDYDGALEYECWWLAQKTDMK